MVIRCVQKQLFCVGMVWAYPNNRMVWAYPNNRMVWAYANFSGVIFYMSVYTLSEQNIRNTCSFYERLTRGIQVKAMMDLTGDINQCISGIPKLGYALCCRGYAK
jgi:hypothetical protein